MKKIIALLFMFPSSLAYCAEFEDSDGDDFNACASLSDATDFQQASDRAVVVASAAASRAPLGENQIICGECGRNFVSNAVLINHMRMDHDEKPFGCKDCGRKFSQRGDLNEHEKRMHARKDFVSHSTMPMMGYMQPPMPMGYMQPYMQGPVPMGYMQPYMQPPVPMGYMQPYMQPPVPMGYMQPYMQGPVPMRYVQQPYMQPPMPLSAIEQNREELSTLKERLKVLESLVASRSSNLEKKLNPVEDQERVNPSLEQVDASSDQVNAQDPLNMPAVVLPFVSQNLQSDQISVAGQLDFADYAGAEQSNPGMMMEVGSVEHQSDGILDIDSGIVFAPLKPGQKICHICKLKCLSYSKLKIHIRCHTKEKCFACEICHQPFAQKAGLQRHMKIHNRADAQNFMIFSAAMLLDQINVESFNFCHYQNCFESFFTIEDLEAHQRNAHSQLDVADSHFQDHAGAEESNSNMMMELSSFEHQSNAGPAVARSGIVSQNQFPCTFPSCKKVFFSNSNLQRHIKVIHYNERPFSCLICDKSCATSWNLAVHMKKNHKKREGAFFCEICNKEFSEEGKLENHMNVHTGKASFFCEICGDSFNEGFKLKVHKTKAHKKANLGTSNSLSFEQVAGGGAQQESLPNDDNDDAVQEGDE